MFQPSPTFHSHTSRIRLTVSNHYHAMQLSHAALQVYAQRSILSTKDTNLHNMNDYEGCFEPAELLAATELSGDLGDFTPSAASCSRNSDHSSARDSFLLLWLLLSNARSVLRDGVLGVLCQGEIGTLRFGFDAPGRARPACSRCSGWTSVECHRVRRGKNYAPSVQASRPAIICSTWNFLGSPLSKAMKCMRWFVTSCLITFVSRLSIQDLGARVLLVNGVLGFAFLQVPQRFRQMVFQNDAFVPKLSNGCVLLIHFLFKRKGSVELIL